MDCPERRSQFFPPLLDFAAVLVLALCLAAGMGRAGDAELRRMERHDGIIESLDTTSGRRARVLESIQGELRGNDAREMRAALREALHRNSSLIVQGAVEALALNGDPEDVPHLETLLATSGKLEVKYLIIRLLPAFCIGTERARSSFIQYAAGYDRHPRPGVLEALRRPPLSRRGRLDGNLERLQGRVIRSIADQFDPVGSALRHLDNPISGEAARWAIRHYLGGALGNDPSRWARIWAAQGQNMLFRVPDEVEEIRLAALLSLSDMGAEALPEVIDAFRILRRAGGDILQQAAFETMADMCRAAFRGYPALAAMRPAPEDALETDAWRARRYESAANLALFTAETADESLMTDADHSVFVAAAAAMGAALAFPDDFPDPGGRLATARPAGLTRLEWLLLMPDMPREKRAGVATALGETGALRAVSALTSILYSPYCSPAFGIDGTRMAEAAIDALREAATTACEGRDAARGALLALLEDERVFPPLRSGTPPVGLAHMVLWRLQRLARSTDISLEPAVWRERLGW